MNSISSVIAKYALARVPPHNRAHRHIGLQRRRIDGDPPAFQQPVIGQHPQHPGKHLAMPVQIDLGNG
jgi:hypothetical protein